ncbi:hypothetical protein T12_16825 [Trichinella patagoniensis]|uniref:Uncharacterized protein n=1 Tax=Trichinella patagoniensis TaxID=990121 RepID=A0A0V0ZMK1_9BILA|nr:hypothetical protein T12_16825 [Trichinella patagoniensis]
MDDGLGDTAIIQRCCCIRQDAPRRRHLTNAIWQDNVTGCRKLPQTGNTVQAGQTASGAAHERIIDPQPMENAEQVEQYTLVLVISFIPQEQQQATRLHNKQAN